jgi:hypothetical protein
MSLVREEYFTKQFNFFYNGRLYQVDSLKSIHYGVTFAIDSGNTLILLVIHDF